MTKSTIFTDEELREAFEEANTNYNFEAKQKYASKSYVRQLHINRTALKRWIDQRSRTISSCFAACQIE